MGEFRVSFTEKKITYGNFLKRLNFLEKFFYVFFKKVVNFRFRIEYEKLHKALKKSHESEKRLMSKCRELNAEIVSNSSKVAQALKLSQDDQV